jgi:hypothetical protein
VDRNEEKGLRTEKTEDQRSGARCQGSEFSIRPRSRTKIRRQDKEQESECKPGDRRQETEVRRKVKGKD